MLWRRWSVLIAASKQFQFVFDVTETVFPGNLFGPGLKIGCLDFHRFAAFAADEVMVVLGRATPVGRLPVGSAKHIEFVGVDHELQSAVDRGDSHFFSRVGEFCVKLLRGLEL